MVIRAARRAGIGILVLVGLPFGSTSRSEVPEPQPAGGLKLVVSQSLDKVEVMVAARVTRIRPEWAPPVLAGPEAPAELRELLVVFHDQGGRPLGVYGFPGVGAEAFDVLIPGGEDAGERLTGRVSFPAVTDRILELPLPGGSAYLVLALARVGEPRAAHPSTTGSPDRSCVDLGAAPEGTRALELTAFSVYSLDQEFGGPASVPEQQGTPLSPPFPGFPPLQIRPGCQPAQLRSSLPPCPAKIGYVDRVPLLAAAGAGDLFDIVILGDGFESADFPKLQNFASQLASSLPAAAPFDQFPGKIKIDLVRTYSGQSGITKCSTPGNRDTYYEVEGRWTDEYGTGGPGYLGTRALCRILSAVDTVLPWPDVDLIVMIANCDEYGGRAQFGDHLIYLTTWLNPNTPDPPYGSFKRVALHETGHAVAWLGEEYVACAKPDPAYPFPKYFPNVAPRRLPPRAVAQPAPPMPAAGGGGAVILGPAIWWQELLNASERLPSGGFAAVHRCGDPWANPGPAPCGPVVPAPGSATMLGLFWGAMYGEPTSAPNQCEVRCEDPTNPGPVVGTASCDYFRPQANCRMRTLSAPWCRACMAKMTEALQAATGP